MTDINNRTSNLGKESIKKTISCGHVRKRGGGVNPLSASKIVFFLKGDEEAECSEK